MNYYFFYGPVDEKNSGALCRPHRTYAAAAAVGVGQSTKPLELLPGHDGRGSCETSIANAICP